MTTATPPTIPLRGLGRSGVRVPALGVGTNRWGLPGTGPDQLLPVFGSALDAGTNLFDTAEIYQLGGSESALGECIRRDPRPIFLVTKFAPYPARLTSGSMITALEASLTRLGLPAVDLYLIHFPFSLRGIASSMDWLGQVARTGMARAVGVSNFSARQMCAAASRLERHGIPLAANEVQFSLFHRHPERDGVLEACRKLEVTLIAYRPLAGGRSRRDGSPLDAALARIANVRGKTNTQVMLNWLLGKDERVVAIPGATSAGHLLENAGAIGWTLGGDEIADLEQSSA